jgi:hypothetical protein
LAKTLDNGVHHGSIHYERRCQQDVIPALAIDCTTHRVDHEAARHRFMLHARVQLQLWVESVLGAAIGDELEALKQPAAAHIPNEGMIAKPFLEPSQKVCTLRMHICEQVIAAYYSKAAAQASGWPEFGGSLVG